jgi:hypothetical protein
MGSLKQVSKPVKRELVFEMLEKWVFNKEASCVLTIPPNRK